MIHVIVVGYQNKNGMRLLKNMEKAIQNIETKINLKAIYDDNSDNYGIKNVPGLIIDGEIVCQGKVLSERELHRIILSFA